MTTQTIIIPRDPLAVFAQHDATTPELLAELQALKDYLETSADQCWRAGLGNTTAAAFARGQEKAYKDALRRLEAILADHVTVSLVAADA